MTSTPTKTPLEIKLIQELTAVDLRIAELEAEKRSLQRLLSKVRQEALVNRDVTRKNSFDRIVIENVIIQRLTEAKRPLHADALLFEARTVTHTLKGNTFRSYLHRLKLRGLIKSSGRGTWQLVSHEKDPDDSLASKAE
ncbi:hypothetical protein [Ferrovibrio terrae]|uniref:hypothetical protein n=1 Tax=Ferrovibrio terrae TaxID=2594003 RepID=UPI0031381AEC